MTEELIVRPGVAQLDEGTLPSPSAIVGAVLNAGVAKRDPSDTSTRSIYYYFTVGLDHYDMYDSMRDRLLHEAEERVSAILAASLVAEKPSTPSNSGMNNHDH